MESNEVIRRVLELAEERRRQYEAAMAEKSSQSAKEAQVQRDRLDQKSGQSVRR